MFAELLAHGISGALLPVNLLLLVSGVVMGMVIGIIPGLSAANGIALMLPVSHAFGFTPQSALILYASVYYGTKYGSRVSAILQGVPGDISSQATTIDGFPLAVDGSPGKILQLTAWSSFAGSVAAVMLLLIVVGFLPEIGQYFGPPEYVALLTLAFVLIVVLSSTELIKTICCLAIGLMLSAVGLDWGTGVFRFSAQIPQFYDGIDFTIVVIGVFTVSEALVMVDSRHWSRERLLSLERRPFTTIGEIWQLKWSCLRATIIGLVLGVLPGSGPYVANLAAYRLEHRLQKKERAGEGGGDQLRTKKIGRAIAPEAANSSCAIAAFVPLLALGIPGSATTAVLLGALQQMNLDIGTQFIALHKELVWALIASMLFGNIILVALNISLLRLFPYLLFVPGWFVMPVIVVISFVGVYAVNQSMISLGLMTAIGILAYGLRKFHYPLAPLILGYVLGKPFEDNLRLALAISNGDYFTFVGSNLAIGLLVTSILAIFVKLFWKFTHSETFRLDV